MEIVKDLRVGNAILKRMAEENNFDINNVFIHVNFKYIDTIDISKNDVSYCVTEYKGNKYKVKYFDGCFNPFIVKL